MLRFEAESSPREHDSITSVRMAVPASLERCCQAVCPSVLSGNDRSRCGVPRGELSATPVRRRPRPVLVVGGAIFVSPPARRRLDLFRSSPRGTFRSERVAHGDTMQLFTEVDADSPGNFPATLSASVARLRLTLAAHNGQSDFRRWRSDNWKGPFPKFPRGTSRQGCSHVHRAGVP